MVFSIFKNIIKSVLPASLWLNLRLFRETNINRKVAKDYIKQMLNDKSPITTQMDQHIIGACDVFEYKSILEVGSGGGRLSYWYLFNRKDFSGIEPDIWYRKLVNNQEQTEETRTYVKEKLRAALWLLKSVDQRQETIQRVARSIASFQSDFLDRGIISICQQLSLPKVNTR